MVHASFPELLRSLMTERAIGVRALARAVPCNSGHMSKVANGHKRPSPELAARLDKVLDAGGMLTAAGIERVAATIDKPSRVDTATVDIFAEQLAATRRLEDSIGPAPLVAVTTAQLDLVTDTLRQARPAVRGRVVHQAAQWAQYAGWLRAATGNTTAGLRHLAVALEWATESGDANLVSEVMSFRGHVAWMRGDIAAMIGLSGAAARPAGLYPGQAAISNAQAAIGNAIYGEAHEMHRLLDLSDEQAADAEARADESPPWLYYHVPGFFTLHRGRAYRHLATHDPTYRQRAADVLAAGLETLPAEMSGSEWAAEFTADLAALS